MRLNTDRWPVKLVGFWSIGGETEAPLRCTGERREDRRSDRRTSKASEASSSLNVSGRFLQATSHDFPQRDLNAQ